MPWCPVCKNEYIEGKTHCPDCDVDLVEELPEEVSAPEQPQLTPEEIQDIRDRQAATAHMTTHVSAKAKQSDMKSSAWSFLIIGIVGLAVITLAIVGVITLPLNLFALCVMEGLFVIFLIIAFFSFKKAMSMLDDISREGDLDAKVRAWAKEHLTRESLMEDVEEDTAEEMKYFMVSEQIRERIMKEFPEVDDSYAEALTEDFYNQLFSGE